MKYNALHAPCDAKVTLTSDIPTFRDKKAGGCTSSCAFGSQGGGGGVCGFLSQSLLLFGSTGRISTTLQSRLVVCKVRNERNLS